jgi:sRNA-binding regulator protein Hfq
MGNQPILPAASNGKGVTPGTPHPRAKKRGPAQLAIHLTSHAAEEESGQRQAELFYLQKQIQAQTSMVILLEDGETVEGCIEWYDRNSLKVRGRAKTLIYKSAIKYMYKVGDSGK